MKIKRVVKPGQPGTKKLVQQYGDNLICVRYRYDAEKRRMFKTIELIVENQAWQPNGQMIPPNKILNLRIAKDETDMRMRVKKAGGKWNATTQVWRLPYHEVLKLGLVDRVAE